MTQCSPDEAALSAACAPAREPSRPEPIPDAMKELFLQPQRLHQRSSPLPLLRQMAGDRRQGGGRIDLTVRCRPPLRVSHVEVSGGTVMRYPREARRLAQPLAVPAAWLIGEPTMPVTGTRPTGSGSGRAQASLRDLRRNASAASAQASRPTEPLAAGCDKTMTIVRSRAPCFRRYWSQSVRAESTPYGDLESACTKRVLGSSRLASTPQGRQACRWSHRTCAAMRPPWRRRYGLSGWQNKSHSSNQRPRSGEPRKRSDDPTHHPSACPPGLSAMGDTLPSQLGRMWRATWSRTDCTGYPVTPLSQIAKSDHCARLLVRSGRCYRSSFSTPRQFMLQVRTTRAARATQTTGAAKNDRKLTTPQHGEQCSAR
jgi:hypothetical protein